MKKKILIEFEQSEYAIKEDVNPPCKGHATDSGFDIFNPRTFLLDPGQRITINLEVRFKLLEKPIYIADNFCQIIMEAQIRPKSGRSKNGIDVELGTIDNGYRGFVGATITNTTKLDEIIYKNEKICQIVFAPICNNIELAKSKIDNDTARGDGGFGSTTLKQE